MPIFYFVLLILTLWIMFGQEDCYVVILSYGINVYYCYDCDLYATSSY